MTPEQLTEIEERNLDCFAGDAVYNADVWILKADRDALVAEVKRLTAELEQANRGGAELGKTINYLAEVMRLAAVTMTDHGPVAGMHVLFNHMAEAETLTEDEHAKAWAALQAYEAQEKRTADERAEQARRELSETLSGGQPADVDLDPAEPTPLEQYRPPARMANHVAEPDAPTGGRS